MNALKKQAGALSVEIQSEGHSLIEFPNSDIGISAAYRDAKTGQKVAVYVESYPPSAKLQHISDVLSKMFPDWELEYRTDGDAHPPSQQWIA